MKTIANIFLLALWCMVPLLTYAQGAHWTCDERAFQYDMTAYISLVSTCGNAVDLSAYEVAAFVGNECRGIARLQKAPNGVSFYGYIRIHSNVSSGEAVTVKAYSKSLGAELAVESETVTFEANSVKGLPSAPFALTLPRLLGDVNCDGIVTVGDVTALVNIILSKDTLENSFGRNVADVNRDGTITIADVTALVNIIIGNSEYNPMLIKAN